MYSHILVPVDGTELSTYTVNQALTLAKTLGARVTFFYATPDYYATETGVLSQVLAPEEAAEGALGATRAILAKAMTAANARNVPCDGRSRVTDRPHEAIVEAAKAYACDLIFMASHGRRTLRGLIGGSMMERVVRNSTVPVLVSSVEVNDPDLMMHRALAIIHDEHRSLSVVIQGLLHFLDEAVQHHGRLDTGLVRRMIQYIHDFPGKRHHPKEELYVFAKLRQRTSAFNELLDELTAQHRRESDLVTAAEAALTGYETEGAGALLDLDKALRDLADAIWNHMGKEERVILPAAKAHLAESDWQEIADAFATNNDPRFGDISGDNFSQMFVKIANLVPGPVFSGEKTAA